MKVLPLAAREYFPLYLNIMDKDDDSYYEFETMPKEPGYWDFIAHCDGIQCSKTILFHKTVLNADQVIDLILNESDWVAKGRQNIRFLACYAGKYSNGIAYQVHKALGVTVKAPRLTIWRNPLWRSDPNVRPYVITELDPNALPNAVLRRMTDINNPNDGWQYFPA